MSMSNLSRRDRAVLAAVGVVALYGLLVLLFFTGRREAWERASRKYGAEVRKLEAQNRLIAETAKWTERDASSRLQMPEVEDGASTNVRWQRIHADLAKNFHVVLKTVVAREEEEHGGVWELPIDVSYEASLERLVEFLHALGQAEGAMFDVRELEIQVQNNGFLRGRYVLTCAYMKKES